VALAARTAFGGMTLAVLCHTVGCTSPSKEPPAGMRIDLVELAIGAPADPDLRAVVAAQVERARSASDPGDAVEPLLALALLERAVRDLDSAERHLAEARARTGASTPRLQLAWLDWIAAAVLLERNRPEEAVASAERARDSFRAVGDDHGTVEAIALLITARGMHQARFEEAFALVDSCLAAARAAGGEVTRLRCINARAALAYNLADYEAAMRDYAELTAPSSALPEKLEATARLNLALCHIHLGQYADARLAIERALDASRLPGRTAYPEAVPLYYRGYLLSRLGDHEGAFDDYVAALALFRAEQNRYFESFLLVDIGDNLLRRGLPRRAIEEYERSLELYRAAGNPRGTMLVEEGIGRSLLELGDRVSAERRLRRALELAGEVGDDHAWARIAALVGDRLLRESAPAEAEALLRRAVDRAAAKGLLEEQFRAMLGLARTQRDQSRRAASLADYRAALDLLDRIRDHLSSESQHLTFSESRNVVYREAVDVLLDDPAREATVAEAFSVTERARARSLLELMQRARLAGATRTPERRRERLAILARLAHAQSALLAAPDAGEPARAAFRQAGEELERFDLEEAAALPAAVGPRPLDLPAVAARVGEDRTLVAYWIGPGRSCLWRVHDGAASLVQLPDHRELEPAIEAYRAAIDREPGLHNPPEAWRDAAQSLARMLRLDAVLDGVRGGTLLVVPDGPLHGVPLEPLVTGDTSDPSPELLGDRFDLVYLPSASFLALEVGGAADRDSAARLFAVGDPSAPATAAPLPGAREEVRRIARWFADGRAELRLGEHATKGVLHESAAAAADILHIAARTVTPGGLAGQTAIALAPEEAGGDGLLRPHEIASLALRARLVVLSACGTGLGRSVAGEGLQGLARAFLIAGVPAIVPSQWDVSDRATAELMERFYRGLAAGEPPQRALARAALELRRESLPLYAHPHYWAPFTLFGLPPSQ
jgi:tetratricopeptide (TPR) repeat protein